MYRGTVSILRRSTRAYWLVGGGIAFCVLFVVAGNLFALSAGARFALHVVFPVAYLSLLSVVLRPRFAPANIYVDHTGVYVEDALLVAREDIAEAFLTPAREARPTRVDRVGYLTLPAYPLTVALMKRRGRQVNIAPSTEQDAAAILTALGWPVTMAPPDYRPKTTARQWALTAVVVVVFLAALFGFSYYKSTGH